PHRRLQRLRQRGIDRLGRAPEAEKALPPDLARHVGQIALPRHEPLPQPPATLGREYAWQRIVKPIPHALENRVPATRGPPAKARDGRRRTAVDHFPPPVA